MLSFNVIRRYFLTPILQRPSTTTLDPSIYLSPHQKDKRRKGYIQLNIKFPSSVIQHNDVNKYFVPMKDKSRVFYSQ